MVKKIYHILKRMLYNKTLLFICAIIGSIAGYYIINYFITSIDIKDYILIEVVISLFHYLYNVTKNQILINK